MADQTLYRVEKILGRKVLPNRKAVYLVRWRDFTPDHDSWETKTNLGACQLLINNFNEAEKLNNQSKTPIKSDSLNIEADKKTPGTLIKPSSKPKITSKPSCKLSTPTPKRPKYGGRGKGSANKSSPIKKNRKKPLIAKKRLIRAVQTVTDNTSSDVLSLHESKDDLEKGQLCTPGGICDDMSKKTDNMNMSKKTDSINMSKKTDNTSKKIKQNKRLSDEDKLSKQRKAVKRTNKAVVGSEEKTSGPSQPKKVKVTEANNQKELNDSSISLSTEDTHTKEVKKLKKKPKALKLTNCGDAPEVNIMIEKNSETGKQTIKTTTKRTKVDGEDVIVVEHISDEELEDDDEDVLYSLNNVCNEKTVQIIEDSAKQNLDSKKTKKTKSSPKSKTNKDVDSDTSVTVIESSPMSSPKIKESKLQDQKKNVKKPKSISLIGSKSLMGSKKTSKLMEKSAALIRSASPPLFTTVKHAEVGVGTLKALLSKPPLSKPPSHSMTDSVSVKSSDSYLVNVSSSYSLVDGKPLTKDVEQPLSSSISYQSYLESISQKNAPNKEIKKQMGRPKKTEGNVSTLVKAGISSSLGKESIDRRASVRTTECAFRYKQIVVKKCARYTQIWLNTSTKTPNGLNPQVINELCQAMNSAKYDDSHLVLFSSLGNVFCSGTDLHFLVTGDRRIAARQMADSIGELTKTFITFPKPIIAAVSGACVGLGVALLAHCDVVYASDKASFHLPYSQLSQTPEGCSSFSLPLMLGLPSANELLFGGRKITAMEAYNLGLVSQVFWPTLMMQEVIPRAMNMAKCSAKALEATKLLIRSHHRTKMELTNETECNLLLERWSSVDCQRAIEAYISNEKNLSF